MKKTYTVLSVTHTKISPEKGSMIWQLRDKGGCERKVNAVTTLDKAGYVDSARPIYARETPLVDRLMLQVEGDEFTIDFSSFNEAMGYIKRDVYEDMQKLEKASRLSSKINRVLLVATVLILCWLGWLTVESFAEFANANTHHHDIP